jgi:hypothetical protein
MLMPRQRLCFCGSGLERVAQYDARGIFLTFACPKCRTERLSEFWPEVLTDPNYQCDEPIDEE